MVGVSVKSWKKAIAARRSRPEDAATRGERGGRADSRPVRARLYRPRLWRNPLLSLSVRERTVSVKAGRGIKPGSELRAVGLGGVDEADKESWNRAQRAE
jgi:hypothetical protein